MRCPICNARVRDDDDLQIHYLEDCTGIGDEAGSDLQRDNGREHQENEPVEELVEVVFKWTDTKNVVQDNIVLISSLAGQVNMRRSRSGRSYKSATVLVPCGVHSCQLVVDEECCPVVDVDIGPASEIVYIILQEDCGGDGAGDTAEEPTSVYPQSSEATAPNQTGGYGSLGQDDVSSSHARKHSSEPRAKGQASRDADDELASMLSHDSNCETMRVKRREKKLEDLAKVEKENLTEIARSGLHQVQVHASREDADTAEERSSQKSYRRQEGDTDLRESEKYVRGWVPERLREGRDGVITPPNGFQTASDSKQRSSTRRQKTLTRIAKSKVSVDSLSDQGSVPDSLNERKEPRHEEDDVPLDEKPGYSWGFDSPDGKRDAATVGYRDAREAHGDLDKQNKSSYSENTMNYKRQKGEQRVMSPTSEEMIADLINKCDDYKADIERTRAANEESQAKCDVLLLKTREQDEELQNKDEKLQELQAKCDSYETELVRMRNEIADITSDFGKLQEDMIEKQEEVSLLEGRLESILQDSKVLKEENESLQTANKLQREDMDRIIQDEVENFKTKLDSVKVGNRSFQYEEMKKSRELEAEVAELTDENKSLKRQLSRLMKEVDSSQRKKSHDGEEGYTRDPLYNKAGERGSGLVSLRTADDKGGGHRNGSSYRPSDTYATRSRPLRLQHSVSEYSERYLDSRASESGPYMKEYSDKNHNSLLGDNEDTRKSGDSFSKPYESSRTSSTNPYAHLDYSGDYWASSRTTARDLTFKDSIDATDYLRRPTRSRRERPRSYHGASATESDSRHLSRHLSALEHEHLDPYVHTISKGQPTRHDLLQKDSSNQSTQHLKPFAPDSVDEILVGMKILLHRAASSGRIGKGIVKWKGYLPGHSDQFIGVELETPNGKHDGTYKDCRYFYCKKDHGVFTKFEKVVMVWGSS